MKHIFKKNQVIITALAIMIAVAGYLNYSGTKLGDQVAPTASEDGSAVSETEGTGLDSALLDMESPDEEFPKEEASADGTLEMEVDLAEGDLEEEASASKEVQEDGALASEQVNDTPGEAVLTSIPSSSGFASEAKLSREQVRAKNKETLMEVINNTNIGEEQKQDAINSMSSMTETAEREAAAELLLESKGFAHAVVSITDDAVDVVIGQSEITDAQRAQIEDIVKRKTSIAAENIVITPMKASE